MWIAIESRILIGRRLASCQWLGCAIVVLGLAVTGGDVASSLERGGLEVALGASMILLGSISHALTWVRSPDPNPNPNFTRAHLGAQP